MEQVGEQFHPFHYSRPGPSKVRVGINSVDFRVRDSRYLSRELGRAFEAVPARRNDDHLRLNPGDIVPVHSNRIPTRPPEGIQTAGE